MRHAIWTRILWRRWKAAPAVALGACLLLAGCADGSPETGAGESAGEAAAEATPGPPTGGDYHSTVMRARHRTLNRVNEIQSIREEQVREERAFDK